MRSQLSTVSWRTPSSIRSDEPSEIARNKIAELQCVHNAFAVARLCVSRIGALVGARAGCALNSSAFYGCRGKTSSSSNGAKT